MGRNKIKRNKTDKYVAIACIIIITYLILDYSNIFSFITKELNFNALSILVNTIVVLLVFFITFALVNKKTFENEEKIKNNKIIILIILLQKVYNQCTGVLKTLENNQMVKKYVIPKIDFNSSKNPVIENLKEQPFENEKYIVELLSNGIVGKQIIENYFEIKDKYQKYVNNRITFFDIYDKQDTNEHKELYKILNNEKLFLQDKIKYEIQQLETFKFEGDDKNE